jgi:hypothetical protein
MRLCALVISRATLAPCNQMSRFVLSSAFLHAVILFWKATTTAVMLINLFRFYRSSPRFLIIALLVTCVNLWYFRAGIQSAWSIVNLPFVWNQSPHIPISFRQFSIISLWAITNHTRAGLRQGKHVLTITRAGKRTSGPTKMLLNLCRSTFLNSNIRGTDINILFNE